MLTLTLLEDSNGIDGIHGVGSIPAELTEVSAVSITELGTGTGA